LNDVSAAVVPAPELNAKTRRVSAPPPFGCELVDESASSMAPAMSTLSGKAPIRRRRYLLGVAGAGLALAAAVPRITGHGSPVDGLSHAARFAVGAAAVSAVSPVAATLHVPPSLTAVSSPSASAPVAAVAGKKRTTLRQAVNALGAAKPDEPRAPISDQPLAPAAAGPAPIEAGMDLSRDPIRTKRVTRELDTSDPWTRRK
jgi:hypothetical protein